MEILLGVFEEISRIFLFSWWIIIPLILIFAWGKLWMIYIRQRYVASIKWTLLQLKVPKDILKTPKAMELVFTEIAAAYSSGMKTVEIYYDGKVEPWFSFEIVGHDGGVYFYIYLPGRVNCFKYEAHLSPYGHSGFAGVYIF